MSVVGCRLSVVECALIGGARFLIAQCRCCQHARGASDERRCPDLAAQRRFQALHPPHRRSGGSGEAVDGAHLPFKVLDEHVETVTGKVSISTMHLAKGLEFRTVVVMGCDDEVIPLQERIETVGDDADLQEIYETERHLLYVACTRARDYLLVTGVKPASEFIDDLQH